MLLGFALNQVYVYIVAMHLASYKQILEAVHCKKLKVDLTQENVISVALWFHLGPGSGPPPVAMVKGYTPFPVKNSSKT